MTWNWYDIKKRTEMDRNLNRVKSEQEIQAEADDKAKRMKDIQARYNEAKRIQGLPKLPSDEAIGQAKDPRDKKKERLAEAGKSSPSMFNLEAEESKRIAENLLEETKPKPPAKPAEPAEPAKPAKPKESLSSRAKRLVDKGKKMRDRVGHRLIRNLKPSGNPKRITTGGRKQPTRITMGGKQPRKITTKKQPKPATSSKQEGGSEKPNPLQGKKFSDMKATKPKPKPKPLSGDVKGQLKDFKIDDVITND